MIMNKIINTVDNQDNMAIMNQDVNTVEDTDNVALLKKEIESLNLKVSSKLII